MSSEEQTYKESDRERRKERKKGRNKRIIEKWRRERKCFSLLASIPFLYSGGLSFESVFQDRII